MIKTLTIENFRKVEHDVMVFAPGLNVIRGPNEVSKSSRIEAMLYALFGTPALRESLDATVTWGKDAKSLKVSVEIEDQSGQVYTFTRSKGGAEVQKDGTVFVTGQKEVSAFAATVLGADVKTASNLMLSNQRGLRGVLDEGPKATSQVIESLANFDLFDTILEAATEKLSLGSTAPLVSRIELLKQQLEALPDVVKPDLTAHQAQLDALTAEVESVQRTLSDTLRPQYEQALAAWRAASDIRNQAAALSKDIALAQSQVTEARARVEAVAELASEPLPDFTDINARIEKARTLADRREKRTLFDSLPAVTRSVPRSEWEHEVSSVEARAAAARDKITQLKADIRVLESQRVSASVCGLCGKDVSELPEVKEKNDKLSASIKAASEEVETLTAQVKADEQALKSVPLIQAADAKLLKGARTLGNLVTVDETVIPAALTWVGGSLEDGESLSELQRISSDLTVRQKRILEAIGQRDAHTATLVAAEARAKTLEDQLNALVMVSDREFEGLEAEYLGMANHISTTEVKVREIEEQRRGLQHAFDLAMKQYEGAAQVKDGILVQIAQTQKDIETTDFNNALVRKVRAARPIVANKLWNIVLTLVSQQFTKMRGVPSTVTRGSEGFLVNGKGINGLSGSALDLLGLAVRTALVRTFVPGCSMMVLDEPAAACDDNRSMSLLSFIAASNFDQVILITHEDVSESFAANLIQL